MAYASLTVVLGWLSGYTEAQSTIHPLDGPNEIPTGFFLLHSKVTLSGNSFTSVSES